jgi:DNA-formamidopyrimidine glycosylase
MPELPEVEVTRLSFASRIAGARITQVRMGKPLRWPMGVEPAQLVGQTVLGVRRRGKYLLLDLSEGLLLLHLGMSGSIAFDRQLSAAGVHDHFDLQTSHGLLRLNDPRRFGAVVFALNEADAVARKLLGKLGVEPLGDAFDLQNFVTGLKQRKAPIKQVLLAGEVVVGVGNIYASEALFLPDRARLQTEPDAHRTPAGCDSGCAGACRAQGWQHVARLLQCPGRVGLFPARSHGVWPRRPALQGLRNADQGHSAMPALHVFLPGVPEKLSTRHGRGAILKDCRRGTLGYFI